MRRDPPRSGGGVGLAPAGAEALFPQNSCMMWEQSHRIAVQVDTSNRPLPQRSTWHERSSRTGLSPMTQASLQQFYIPEEQSIYLLSHDDARKLKA
ncbi:MAG: hypothetical protein R3215_15450, partial [Halomonas sp.]|nr:hypothetical protein [Halomonas sp.]